MSFVQRLWFTNNQARNCFKQDCNHFTAACYKNGLGDTSWLEYVVI